MNEVAKRVFAYDRAGRMGFGPSVPYDFKLGRFYLPDLSASDERSKRVLIVAPERVLPGMPSYRALVDILISATALATTGTPSAGHQRSALFSCRSHGRD